MKVKSNKIQRLVLMAFAIILIAFFAGMPSSASTPEIEGIYKAKCTVCHGADGCGNTATGKKLQVKDFRSPEVQKMTDAQLSDIIGHGKNKMPGYDATLGREKVNQLVTYIRELCKK